MTRRAPCDLRTTRRNSVERWPEKYTAAQMKAEMNEVVKVEQRTATAPSTITSSSTPRKPRKMPAWMSVLYTFITTSNPTYIIVEVARMIDTSPSHFPRM